MKSALTAQYNKHKEVDIMKKTIKLFTVLLSVVVMLTFCSCETKPAPISSSNDPVVKEYNINPLNYYLVYCTDNMATTEIAINDQIIYCKWLDDNDQEHVSVIENIIEKQDWTHLSQQDEIDIALTYFKNYNYQPFKENVGECLLYTDKNNDFFITDIDADITYNLQMNLTDWRRFATNNTDTFAFLSAEPIVIDNKQLYEVRVYKIHRYPSDSIYQNTTLLRNMTASDDLNNIDNIKILSGTCATDAPVITDKKDLQFLQKYTYSHYRCTKKEYAEQLLKDKSNFSLEVVTKTGEKIYLYVMQDGSIATRQMCGDSEVPEISYDFYTADKDNTLTKEKIENF